MSSHHGNTPAAWTGVTIVLLGFLVGGIGLALENMTMFWIGVALGPIGVIVAVIMSKMGLGEHPIRH
jgi:hypothetical protein